MPRSKRAGPFEQDSDGAEQDVSSSQSSSVRKRRRGNNGSPIDSTPVSEDDDQSPPTSPPLDDNQTSDDEEVASDIQQFTAEDNEPAEYGILESVHVVNFMCHENEKWELSPLINFMCGKNGSGKSAILTAIIICLGGKAATTGRGSGLKDYIRHGARSASVTCCLKNQSSNAYRHDDYGDSISVERSWNLNALDKVTSTFTIRNANGKKMASTKTELDEIMDHFCLQIENPLNILTQDEARSFITASDDAKKYKSFLKGVMLEQLDQDYTLIEEQRDNIGPKLQRGEEDLAEKKRLRELATQKLKQSEAQHTNRERLNELRHQCIWSQVEESEKVRDGLLKAIAEFDEKLSVEEARFLSYEADIERVEVVYNTKKSDMDAANAQVDAAKATKSDVNDLLKEKTGAQSAAQLELRQIRDELNATRKKRDQKKKELETEEARLAEIDGGGAAQRRYELEALKKAADEAGAAINAHRDAATTLVEDMKSAAQNVRESEKRYDDQHNEVKDRKNKLRASQVETTRPDTIFHQNMPQLIQAINRESGFREKPVGPIGKFITVLEPKWGSILEKVFGGTLSGFVVSHKADQELLLSLAGRCGVQNLRVNMTSATAISIQGKEPDETHLTILRALRIDNVQIRNVLIVAHFVEASILVEDFSKAQRIMNTTDPRERATNVSRCYTFRPGDTRKGIMLHYKNGMPAQDPINEWRGLWRMNSNVQDQIRLHETSVREAENTLSSFQEQIDTCRRTLDDVQKAAMIHKDQAARLKLTKQRADQASEDKLNEIDEDEQAGGQLDTFREQLAELGRKLEAEAVLYEDGTIGKDKAAEAVREAKAQVDQAQDQLEELQTAAEAMKSEMQQADKDRTTTKVAAAKLTNAINDKKEEKRSFAAELAKAEDEVLEMITGATNQNSERVPIPAEATAESLDKKWEALNAQILASERAIGGDHLEIQARATEAAAMYVAAKRQFQGMSQLYNTLSASVKERKRRWRYFRAHIGKSARASFIHLLSQRGFRGKLIIDHQQHLLKVLVEPDITESDGKGREARTLSGGEKTFAQMCLLLAVWEAMGSPLRCLDEFDVYMDALNRSMTINLLIEAARQSQGRQYILISPGTKGDIQKATDVHAFEVAPPERGQQRLNFQRSVAA